MSHAARIDVTRTAFAVTALGLIGRYAWRVYNQVIDLMWPLDDDADSGYPQPAPKG